MKSKIKVVFDTNIYISAIIYGGNPRTCLDLARERKLELYTSRPILYELTQKLKLKFKWQDFDIIDVVEGLTRFIKVVKPRKKVSIIKKDPSDNQILECAYQAKANYIISGDTRHLLPLKKFKNTKIVSAKEFLNFFYKTFD